MMPLNADSWASLFIRSGRGPVNKFIMDSAPCTGALVSFLPSKFNSITSGGRTFVNYFGGLGRFGDVPQGMPRHMLARNKKGE